MQCKEKMKKEEEVQRMMILMLHQENYKFIWLFYVQDEGGQKSWTLTLNLSI